MMKFKAKKVKMIFNQKKFNIYIAGENHLQYDRKILKKLIHFKFGIKSEMDFQTLFDTMNTIIYKFNREIYKSQGVNITSKTGPKDNRSKLSKQHLIIFRFSLQFKGESRKSHKFSQNQCEYCSKAPQ